MKKKVIIALIILIIIWSIGLGGYIVYKAYKEQNPFEQEWVKIYYSYLKENNENLKKEQETLKYYRKNEKIQFCKVEEIDKPVMLYNYEELGQTFTNIFYINEENVVNTLKTFNKDFKVEYLYSIEEKTYDYYIHETSGKEEKYSKISESIKANKVNENEEDIVEEIYVNNIITFQNDEIISITTLNGEIIEISALDQNFVQTTLVEDNWKDINLNSYEDWIKDEFSKAVKKIKKELTDEEEEEINNRVKEITEKKNKMIKAKEEIEQKQREEELKRAEEEAKRKEEEEKKKAEEEAKKKEEERRAEEARRNEEEQTQTSENYENTIGNYILNYGTYKGTDCWSVENPLSKYETTIELKEDWTYTQTNFIIVANMTETYSGTFKIVEDENLGRIIILSADDNYYKITGNNELTSKTGSIIKQE